MFSPKSALTCQHLNPFESKGFKCEAFVSDKNQGKVISGRGSSIWVLSTDIMLWLSFWVQLASGGKDAGHSRGWETPENGFS